MRTTIDISDELLREAKKRAAEEGAPLRSIVEAALRSYLSGRGKRTGYRLRWKTEQGRVRSGVDLDDRDALFDIMEGRR